MDNIFKNVKAAVTVKDAAEYYGLHANRCGMVSCLFHDDKNPSMKLNDDYFYCFGCNAHGDVIDLAAKLFGLSNYEAAKRIAADFGLESGDKQITAPIKPKIRSNRENERMCFQVLNAYLHKLEKQRELHAPKSPEADEDPLFGKICRSIDSVNYWMDILMTGTPEERKELVEDLINEGAINIFQKHIQGDGIL